MTVANDGERFTTAPTRVTSTVGPPNHREGATMRSGTGPLILLKSTPPAAAAREDAMQSDAAQVHTCHNGIDWDQQQDELMIHSHDQPESTITHSFAMQKHQQDFSTGCC